jgi:molybdopterin converting factor small subunit
MAAAKQKSQQISQLKGKLTGDLEDRISKLTKLEQGIGDLDLEVDVSPLSRYAAHLTSIKRAIKPEPIKILLLPMEEYLEAHEVVEWEQASRDLANTLQELSNQLLVTEKDKAALEAIEFLTSVMELRNHLSEVKREWEVKQKVSNQITTAYNQFLETKHQELQAIYDILREDMQHYYDTLHPGEGHRRISLQIDPKKRGSTEVVMGFHNRKGDPRAFQSEAHLDSLGLCAFLAFVKNFNGDFRLVILDDVVSTIDAQHRRRVCELLYTEFGDYQLFITTQDELWSEELVAYQRAHNIEHNFHNLRILDWSLTDGVRLDRHKPRWELVEERLEERDKVSAAAHARRNLEWILQEMALTTETKVPINPSGRYTVADLYNPFKNRIKKLVPNVFEQNEKVFIQLEVDGIFGNLLTHNNPKAENASIEEVRAFVNAVKNLHSLFTCENGQFIQYHREARIMKCRCGHITWHTK